MASYHRLYTPPRTPSSAARAPLTPTPPPSPSPPVAAARTGCIIVLSTLAGEPMVPRLNLTRSSLLAAAFAVIGASTSLGQAPGLPPPATIRGRLVDYQSRIPVIGARVSLMGTSLETGSDSAGRFTAIGLAGGAYFVEIRAIGYGIGTWLVRLRDGETIDTVFELQPLGLVLDPVVVAAAPTLAQRRLQEFETRRREGRGVFLTNDQMRGNHKATLIDVLRNVPGVRLMCGVRGGCQVRMTRSARGGGCLPDWYVDGLPATHSSSANMPTDGVIGLEIYRSLSETPPEFLKSDAQCGVIAIWTKSGP